MSFSPELCHRSGMDLLSQIKKLVAEECRITAELLRLLERAEKENLYARRGFSSLFDFCVKELGYSEGAAARRIGAMRLMRAHEGLEDKLREGRVSVTVASKLEFAFRKSSLPEEQKREFIRQAEGMTSRELEKKLVSVLPALEVPKRELRPINQAENLLKIVIDNELLEKMNQLRALLSHRRPGMSYRDLVEVLVNSALKKKKHRNTGAGESVRYISPALKQKIRERDGGRCTYVDSVTGRKCQSNHLLEFDHIIPVAHGGRATEQNLRLLCRTHNQLAAENAGLGFKASRPSRGTA